MGDLGYLSKGLTEAVRTIGPMYVGHKLAQERDTASAERQEIRDKRLAQQAERLQGMQAKTGKFLDGRDLTGRDLEKYTSEGGDPAALKSTIQEEERKSLAAGKATIAKEERAFKRDKELEMIKQSGKANATVKDYERNFTETMKLDGGNLDSELQPRWDAAKTSEEKANVVKEHMKKLGYTGKRVELKDISAKLPAHLAEIQGIIGSSSGAEKSEILRKLAAIKDLPEKRHKAEIRKLISELSSKKSMPTMQKPVAPAPPIKRSSEPVMSNFDPAAFAQEQGLLKSPPEPPSPKKTLSLGGILSGGF